MAIVDRMETQPVASFPIVKRKVAAVPDALTRLAIRHGTDKYGYHDYTPNYHKLFSRFRDIPLRLLEIGVGGYQDEDRGGQSLAVWRDYFPQGQITGIDIQKKVLDLGPRVKILQGSQVDPDFLAQVVAERGPFDLIVDDGSHRNEHVVDSWKILWPTLAPGGVYVAEDVQTAFMPRFGGSLTLDPPNSVGFFADILIRMQGDDPALADVVAVERFHNMIALHKAGAEPWPGLWGSNALDRLPERPKVTVAGGALPVQGRLAGAAVTMRAPDALSGLPPQDAVIQHGADPAALRAGLAALGETGLLILPGAPSDDMLADLHDRFVQVDQREIRIHYPKADLDPVCTQIYGIERHPDGVILIKAPNDWPSNFAFDPDHPQAAAAMAVIEAELVAHGAEENGYVQFANMLTNTRGRDAARPWLERLDAIGATARIYYQLAGGLAQKDRDFARAADLFAQALTHYRDDPLFLLNLGAMQMATGDLPAARATADHALAVHPRDVNLQLQMVRIAERMGDHDTAIAHARRAVDLAPPARKGQALAALGEALAAAGEPEEAETTLRDALSADPRGGAARVWRTLSGVLHARGAGDEALQAAEKAVELSPQTREYRDWQARLSA